MDKAKELLTLTQVRERLKASRSSVWVAINEHGLPVVRWGGFVRVREEDLEAWIERHRGGGQKEQS